MRKIWQRYWEALGNFDGTITFILAALVGYNLAQSQGRFHGLLLMLAICAAVAWFLGDLATLVLRRSKGDR